MSRLRWQIAIALSATAALVVLLGLLALSTAATSLPFRENVYVEGVAGVPRQLNPLLLDSTSPASEHDLAALLFDGLTRPGLDGAAQPNLAERWASNLGATVYTFTLRTGLRWHDAMPLTAADVVWTVESVQHPRFAGDPALRAAWQGIRVERIDEQRVRFTLPGPQPSFAAATSLTILPRHAFAGIDPGGWTAASFSRRPVGSGPFRLHALDETHAQLLPFEGAVRGRPMLDVLILRFYSSEAEARNALRRGDVMGTLVQRSAGEEQLRHDQVVEILLKIAGEMHGYVLDRQVQAAGLQNGQAFDRRSHRFHQIGEWTIKNK